MAAEPFQMEMKLDGQGENLFHQSLSDGKFHILIEIPLEYKENSMQLLSGKYQEYLRVLRSNPHNLACSLAFTTEKPLPNGVDEVKVLKALDLPDPGNHLVYLTGRNRTKEEICDVMERATALGYHNFCVVSGEPESNATYSRRGKNYLTESVSTLKELQGNTVPESFVGAAVNPFNYMPESSFLHYLKTMKKLNCGASFLVSQFGWDIRKNQELRWHLTLRGVNIPVIARFMMLSQDIIRAACSKESNGEIEPVDLMGVIQSGGNLPPSPPEKEFGIAIPLDFKRMIQTELNQTPQMFEEQQLRRLQIHAAGFKLLGYNGMQIAGVQSATQLKRILAAIRQTLDEFNDFQYWVDNFNLFYRNVRLSPYPNDFYLYKNLLEIRFSNQNAVQSDAPVAPWTNGEKWQYRIGKTLFCNADKMPAREHSITKRFLFQCQGCDHCNLPQTFYICTENCPLHISNGPCGASTIDNRCPYADKECIFVKQYHIVNELHEYPALEENVVEK